MIDKKRMAAVKDVFDTLIGFGNWPANEPLVLAAIREVIEDRRRRDLAAREDGQDMPLANEAIGALNTVANWILEVAPNMDD